MVTHAEPALLPPALLKRVSWGAIFAGAVSAVALTALLGLLGLGIGFGSLDPAEGDSLRGVPRATLIWWAVTSIVATGIGGFVAARLAGIPRSLTGALHGLAVWSVATLLTLWLATTAVGTLLGATASVVTTSTRVASGVVGTVGGAAIDAGGAIVQQPSDQQVAAARERVLQEANTVARQSGIGQRDVQEAQNAIAETAQNIARQPGQAENEIAQLADQLFRGPDAVLSPAERDRLVTAIANRAGVSRAEAEQIAGRWQTQANEAWAQASRTSRTVGAQAEETAIQLSDDALDILSQVMWGMFLISLAGLVAALIGSALGAPSLGAVAATAMVGDRAYRDDDEDRDHAR